GPDSFGITEDDLRRAELAERAHAVALNAFDLNPRLRWCVAILVLGTVAAVAFVVRSSLPLLFAYPALVVGFVASKRARTRLADAARERERKRDPYASAGIGAAQLQAIIAFRRAKEMWEHGELTREAEWRSDVARRQREER